MASSQHVQNLETYFLFWLDAAVNSSEENLEAQRKLRASINCLTTFEDEAKCEEYVLSVAKDDRIVLIVSGQLGSNLIPRVHPLRQISAIYVYCVNKQEDEQWPQEFNKVVISFLLMSRSIICLCRSKQ